MSLNKENKESFKFDSGSFLPIPVLLRTFQYLRVEDIKRCRLVCKAWFNVCEDHSITSKEKYVFYSGLVPLYKINRFLTQLKRTEIYLELIDVNLKYLKFSKFGGKITTLRIVSKFMHLYAEDYFCQNLTDRAFFHLPKMKCFIYDISQEDRDIPNVDEVDFLNEFLTYTLEMKIEMKSVEKFVWRTHRMAYVERLPYDMLRTIFPNLKSLHLPIVDVDHMLKEDTSSINLLNFEELSTVQIRLDPRITAYHFSNLFRLPEWKKSSIEMFVKWYIVADVHWCYCFFYTRMGLEMLELTLTCELDHNIMGCQSLDLFLRILLNCRKLKTFKFFLNCEKGFFCNGIYLTKFVEAMSRSNLNVLAMPMITFDCNKAAQKLASLKNLECLELHQKILSRVHEQSSFALCEAVSGILKSQSIRKLKMTVETELRDDASYAYGPDKTIIINLEEIFNEKLEHLELTCLNWTCTIVQALEYWNLPNLVTLKLGKLNPPFVCHLDEEMNDKILLWIGKMPRLIDIRIQNLYWLDIKPDKIISLCLKLPKLQNFHFYSSSSLEEQIVHLFAKQPMLKCLTRYFGKFDDPQSISYRVNRQRKSLYTIPEKETTSTLEYFEYLYN